MFEDNKAFDPVHDAKIPLKRTWLSFAIRAVVLGLDLIFSRHPGDFLTWLRSMYYRHKPLSFPIPWMTFDAIREIDKFLMPGMVVFEYGSGHSTVYWASKGTTVYSIENDEKWYGYLVGKLGGEIKDKVDVRYEQDSEGYISTVKNVPDKSFDMIVVDGAYRRECVLAAVPYLKPGGRLVVDNTDWHWITEKPLEGIPDDWHKKVYKGYAPMLGHKSETTIWFKPC